MNNKLGIIISLIAIVSIVFIVFWIIYSIWVDKNPEWINKTGQTSIVLLLVSIGIIKIDEES